jgi:hypothetical protein
VWGSWYIAVLFVLALRCLWWAKVWIKYIRSYHFSFGVFWSSVDSGYLKVCFRNLSHASHLVSAAILVCGRRVGLTASWLAGWVCGNGGVLSGVLPRWATRWVVAAGRHCLCNWRRDSGRVDIWYLARLLSTGSVVIWIYRETISWISNLWHVPVETRHIRAGFFYVLEDDIGYITTGKVAFVDNMRPWQDFTKTTSHWANSRTDFNF